LSGEAAEPLTENIEIEGAPESEAVDESTNGFLDKVNSGTINSSQFMTAIIDLPEKEKKPRTSYKKRKRDSDSDPEFDEEHEEYNPKSKKPKRKKSTASKASKSPKSAKSKKSKKGKKDPPRSTRRPRDAMFECYECDFRVETIGELNIHTYGNHNAVYNNKPTFLDMAEASIAKLSERNGTSRTTLLKTIMADYGHVVEVNANIAKRILNRSIKIGIDMGRIHGGEPGKKGATNIWLPTKEQRKALVNKFTINPDNMHVEDLDVPEGQQENLKSRLSASNVQTPRGNRQTKNSGGRVGVRPAKKDDDEICVVEEKLTPLAKMKAKAYANAKAALAKKLPASFLKNGATKMVRIGPGGIVRAEGGKIVTTLGKLTGTTLAPISKKKAAALQEARVKQKTAAAAAASSSVSAGLAAAAAKNDDEDDDLTCGMCMSAFWYTGELLDHLKNTHNIENPEKHLKTTK